MEPISPPSRGGEGDLALPTEAYSTLLMYIPSEALSVLALSGHSVMRMTQKITTTDYYWLSKLSSLLGVEVDRSMLEPYSAKLLCFEIEKTESKYARESIGLILSGGQPTQRNLNMALIGASRDGYSEIVKFLLSKGADPNANDEAPLRHSIVNKQADIVRVLLSDPRTQVKFGGTHHISTAMTRWDDEILRMLIMDKRFDHSQHRDSLLARATRSGHRDIVEMLS